MQFEDLQIMKVPVPLYPPLPHRLQATCYQTAANTVRDGGGTTLGSRGTRNKVQAKLPQLRKNVHLKVLNETLGLHLISVQLPRQRLEVLRHLLMKLESQFMNKRIIKDNKDENTFQNVVKIE